MCVNSCDTVHPTLSVMVTLMSSLLFTDALVNVLSVTVPESAAYGAVPPEIMTAWQGRAWILGMIERNELPATADEVIQNLPLKVS